MNIPEIAGQMKDYAKAHPLNPLRTSPQDIPKYQREIAPGLVATMTYDVIGDKRCWHLSVGMIQSDLPEMEDDVVAELVKIFLPGRTTPIEVPSIHGRRVRQFVEFET